MRCVPMQQLLTSGRARAAATKMTITSTGYATTPGNTTPFMTFVDPEVVFRFKATDFSYASGLSIFTKRKPSGTQNCFRLHLNNFGRFVWTTYPAGDTSGTTVTQTAASPFVDGTTYWGKATLDVNSGGVNRIGVFYYQADTGNNTEPAGGWTTIETVTTAGVTSIFDGTETINVGANADGTTPAVGSEFYRVIARKTIGGAVAVDFDSTKGFVAHPNLYVPNTSQLWTLQGDAALA